ncbi:MAG: hypothetical protein ACE37B_20750 [Ilumatobacter sp.]|uniref:hypothetical protein n=1 Tax=Ilumatobacter sp. TaxID=1967498 RepID=UPI00391CBF86
MSDQEVDYEDLTTMRLDDDALAEMLAAGGECVFNWTTKEGYPVGVVVAFVYHDGKFFTTCAERRKRVPALRSRPQSGIVINTGGKTATFKGDSVVHANGDPGFDELKEWFYTTLSRVDQQPDDPYRQSFKKFLDSPHRVIIETDARLVVAFDTKKFQRFTMEAMAAGQGAD